MVNTIKLSKIANYSKKRIEAKKVSLENFVTIDNILQNKAGITTATNLPPSENSMPAYEVGNILIGNIRPYLKKIWFANRSGGNSADVLVLDVNKEFDSKFIYYSLFRDDFFNHMMKGAKGTKMPRGDKNQILDFLIPNFNLPTQQKIAAVLSALDAKIELNARINAELESMAKTLYDYWFVQFDFPNEQGKPYKSAGGKMVWNDELKREIPLGWEVGELGDILSLEYGKPLKEEDRSGSGYPVVGSNGIVGYHKEYLVKGYGIVVGRKGTAGAVIWVEDNFFPIDTTFYVQDKLGVNELYFHYQLLSRINFKQFESSSAVPGLNRNFAYSIKVAIPEISLTQEYNKIVIPIFLKVKACNQESQTLKELRDWLLPMLMNGQVTIKT